MLRLEHKELFLLLKRASHNFIIIKRIKSKHNDEEINWFFFFSFLEPANFSTRFIMPKKIWKNSLVFGRLLRNNICFKKRKVAAVKRQSSIKPRSSVYQKPINFIIEKKKLFSCTNPRFETRNLAQNWWLFDTHWQLAWESEKQKKL